MVTSPFLYSAVSSPKYQTLPYASWAYQSKVSSASSPSVMSVADDGTDHAQDRPGLVADEGGRHLAGRLPDPSMTHLAPTGSGK